MNTEVLIKALRCSASVRPADSSCEGCLYRGLDEYDPAIPCPVDVVIDGVSYWEFCDTEKMAIDAANALEEYATYSDDMR